MKALQSLSSGLPSSAGRRQQEWRSRAKAPVTLVSLLYAAMALVGCASPSVENLQDSFAERIASVGSVRDFQRDGDLITFSAPDVSGNDATWRVTIDSVVLEPQDDEALPFRGHILSSWYTDDQLVEALGTMSGLPDEIWQAGVAQDCWALWEADTRRWDW